MNYILIWKLLYSFFENNLCCIVFQTILLVILQAVHFQRKKRLPATPPLPLIGPSFPPPLALPSFALDPKLRRGEVRKRKWVALWISDRFLCRVWSCLLQSQRLQGLQRLRPYPFGYSSTEIVRNGIRNM